MKRNLFLVAGLCMSLAGWAQTDSTKQSGHEDTIRVGNMIIIRNGKNSSGDGSEVHLSHRHNNYKPSNVRTNWWIVDIGFANFNDKTNYSSAGAQAFAPGGKANWFNLRTGKSVDVNIWVFMQRLNVIEHVVNLKYGLGVELNNYRFTQPTIFSETPTTHVFEDSARHFKKNKLAADYITVPLMLNFNFTPNRKNGFGLSAGVSAGYLYSARQKVITSEDGKKKDHGTFDLEPWKISYIAELQLGPVKLYGSYATKSMFKDGLDQTPYTVGLRLSNW